MIDVTCALIRNEENEILVVQRGENSDHPFKWEFPGGKIRQGESDEECIIREIREELDISIVICRRMQAISYDYGTKQIRLFPFICDSIDDLPFLTEHIAYRWLTPGELKDVDFAEADVFVAESYIKDFGLEDSNNKSGSDTVPPAYSEADLKSMVERIMGSREAEWVASSAAENIEILKKLFEFSLSDDKKLAFHSSWIMTKVCDKYPELINPYLTRLIEAVDGLDNESVQRSFLRIISFGDLTMVTGRHHGILADHCFKMLRSGFSAIAVKAYSMEIIYRLALIYPELANELSATIMMLEGDGSAGILSRGKIVLKKLADPAKER